LAEELENKSKAPTSSCGSVSIKWLQLPF
jgi:hypothetical protein